MLLVDDLALSPFKGLMWVFGEIAAAVARAEADESEALTRELQDLYRKLEAGELDEDTFDNRESEILDRIDTLRAAAAAEDPEAP